SSRPRPDFRRLHRGAGDRDRNPLTAIILCLVATESTVTATGVPAAAADVPEPRSFFISSIARADRRNQSSSDTDAFLGRRDRCHGDTGQFLALGVRFSARIGRCTVGRSGCPLTTIVFSATAIVFCRPRSFFFARDDDKQPRDGRPRVL